MPEPAIKIKNVSIEQRCEVCHQSDMFDVETQFCARCQHVALAKAIEEPKLGAAPLPDFLARRVSINTAIKCTNCGEFIMSRSATCRHCGNYVRFEEAAQATTLEHQLGDLSEGVHRTKSAATLSWDFLRLHMWGFPFTLLLTPLTVLGALALWVRTLWLTVVALVKFSRFSTANDPRILEGRHQAFMAIGRSSAALGIVAAAATVMVISGLLAIPLFWDNYAKGRKEFEKNNFKVAEELFYRAMEADPNDIDAKLYYARAIWSQYVDDLNADKTNNEAVARRAITSFRAVLDYAKDLKTKDLVYTQLAEIYKKLGEREEYEQWVLARVAIPHQPLDNQIDAYVKLGTAYANDVTNLTEKYVIKDRFPRIWYPVHTWQADDAAKVKASAAKAGKYLDRALAVAPQHHMASALRTQLVREMEKIELEADE